MTGSARARPPDVLIVAAAGFLAGLLAILGSATTFLVPVVALAALGLITTAFLRPMWGVYVAVLAIPLEFISAGLGNFGLTPTEFTIVATAAGWMAHRLAHGGASLSSPITLPLVALLLAHIPGLLLAENQFVVAKELLTWSAIFVLFLAVLADEDPGTSKRIAAVIAAAGAIVAAVAVVRSAGGDQVAIEFGGIVTDRAEGSFSSPVLLGIFVTVTLPLQLVFMIKGSSLRARLCGLAGVAVSLTALGLALSRGAFVALAIAGVWLLVSWKPARRLAVVLMVLLTTLLLTNFNPASSVVNTDVLVQRITTITSPQTRTARLRFQIWEATPQIVQDNLPFGVGPKNFPNHAADYRLVFPAGPPSNAHNTVLVIATELGIPGLLVLLWLVIAVSRTLIRALKLSEEPEHSFAVGISGVFLALSVDSFTDYSYGANAFFLTVILIAALAARLERSARASEPAVERAMQGKPKLAFA